MEATPLKKGGKGTTRTITAVTTEVSLEDKEKTAEMTSEVTENGRAWTTTAQTAERTEAMALTRASLFAEWPE